MSSPALLRRNLTVNFDRAINFTSQRPEVVDVVVIPLSVPSDAASTANVTLVGGLQSQKIVLSDAVNSAVFQLVPSNEPGLTEPVNYRIAWRQGIVGRTFVTDFAMPDADISFDQLADLGHIIGGETYLQQADLGVPGRVARLNSEGQVVDSSGTPVAGQADISTLQGLLNVEIVNRGRADVSNRVALENELTTQINATLSTAKAYSDAIDASLNTTMASESNSRQSGDTTLGGQISALQTALNGLSSTVGSHTTTLTEKADLDGSGHIPLGEIPAAAITNWVPVADINAMLALRYPQDVQPGDIALVGAGPLIYGLAGVTPSQLNNWILLNRVTSVNGQGGDVELTAADVGAVAATGGMVAMDQVTGLATALGTKATESDLTALTSTVSGIANDTTIVHTVGGVIPHTLNDANMAFINDANEITKKDGTVLEVGGSAVESVNGHTGIVSLTYTDVGALATNGDVAMDHVTGLTTALSTLVDTTDARLSNARTPTTHASSHGVGQADAVTVAQSQVTGLPTLLTNNGLTTISNAVGRIYSLETQVTGLTGGSGGPAGATEFWQSVSPTGDFASDVTFHSPFGYNPTNVAANADGYYLDSAGAASGEAVWPYLHSTGHLELRPWNPSASPDPAYATESDFTTLSTTVAGKADSSALSSLASSASVSSLSSTVSSLSTSVTNKADQSALDTTNATVATLATEAEVTTLTSTVGAKANSSDLATTNGNVAALVTAMTSKASLDGGGHVPVAQLPNFAISQTTGLTTALAGKADVVSGTVPLAQLPMIPGSTQVTGWNTKADLIGGLIPSNQIPSIALTNTQVVANRAAMLALTTSQVQLGDLCFAESERYLTWDGTKTFGETVGTSQMVLGRQGEWTPAEIRSFGEQELYRVVVSRYGRDKEILVTADHRWFKSGKKQDKRDYSYRRNMVECRTVDLAAGDFLRSTFRNKLTQRLRLSAVGIQAGIVFGDGTIRGRGRNYTSVVKLYGEKNAQLLKWFPLSPTRHGANANGIDWIEVCDLPGYFKDLPSLMESRSYLYGWLSGYFSADGNVAKDGTARLDSTSFVNIQQAQDICHVLGIKTYGVKSQVRPIRLPDKEPEGEGVIYSLTLNTRDLGEDFFLIDDHRLRAAGRISREEKAISDWAVKSVEPTGRIETVCCAVVPNGQAFVLDGNILTGNCIITATADQGSYVLNSSDPSQFSNWVELATPLAPVSSVNGQTGTVVLAWGDVGALAANAAIPISQVSNLQTTLNGLATTTALNSAIAGATTPSQVQAMLSSSVETKRADYVANSAVASLSGQQSVDGVLMPVGAIVLLTAQASSVTNGSWCVDEETEILTRSGYKSHVDLIEGEETLTFNLVTGMAEWQPVLSVHRFEVEDTEMLSMERSDHSSFTTMDHRWPVERRRKVPEEIKGERQRNGSGRYISDKITGGPWHIIRRSRELTDIDHLIRSAPVVDLPDQPKYTDALVELVAWFITEGHIRVNNTGSLSTGVRIDQSYKVNLDKVYRIRAALTKVFGSMSVRRDSGRPRADDNREPRWTEAVRKPGISTFSLNTVAGQQLCDLAPCKVASMEFIHSLTEAQLRLFLDTCISADGCVNRANGTRVFTQKSWERMQPVQVAATLLGIATTQASRRSGHGSEVYVLTLCERRRYIRPQLTSATTVSYSGAVWCPRTENGTWFARRRGTTYFTGNTVNSGPWTRAADFATGSWLVTGSLVLVSNKTASGNGTARNNTFWRMTATSGVVDTNANNWTNVMTAGPPLVYTQGNGIAISNQQVSAVVAPSGGCQLTSSGIGIDTTTVVRKYVTAVPGGSPIVTITHGLNSTSPLVGLINVASGDIELIGPTVTGANTISLEFQSAPATGQWRCVVFG